MNHGNGPFSIQRLDAYELIKQAVIDGIAAVKEATASGKFFPRYFRFPSVDYFRSGFPRFFETDYSAGPIRYSEIFGDNDRCLVKRKSLQSWIRYREFAESDEFIKTFFMFGKRGSEFPTVPEWDSWMADSNTFGILAEFVDRLIHKVGMIEFNEQVFAEIYREWENYVFSPNLHFSIWIPILCLKFAPETFYLDSVTSIQRMPDAFQLARNVQCKFNVSTVDCVIGAATHALVLHDWKIENNGHRAVQVSLAEFASFSSVLPRIENFFASLRSACVVESGYSQVVVKPLDWGHSWTAALPYVQVVSTRAYPDHLDDFGWLLEPTPLTENDLQSAKEIYGMLRDSNSHGLQIAAKRLNAAHLRRDEADSILDVTIGMEALLGDNNSKTEMTHKLAMRTAALASIESCPEGTPEEVFRIVRKIYEYRSSIVHGAKNPSGKRVISTKQNPEVPTVALGIRVLRYLITALARHSEFLDPIQLDFYLISRKNRT